MKRDTLRIGYPTFAHGKMIAPHGEHLVYLPDHDGDVWFYTWNPERLKDSFPIGKKPRGHRTTKVQIAHFANMMRIRAEFYTTSFLYELYDAWRAGEIYDTEQLDALFLGHPLQQTLNLQDNSNQE